ncbi:MAG: alpha-glucosidase/alpha-galactosidase [Acidimicrobiia bacterium]
MTAVGHQAHIQAAERRGLPGAMPRPITVTMLGAGSMFTPELAKDLFLIPENAGGTIALVDIDAPRLDTMTKVVGLLAEELGVADRWTVRASVDRREVLPGTDYVVNCIEVSGVDCVGHDNDIPARYGVDQCIGDTIGPGGVFKGLRTIPVWLEVLADVERLCPRALVLNYTNPMSMMCLAAARTSPVQVVGLCHSVQATSRVLAARAGIPWRELTWECAGVNHLAWFTRLEHEGRDLYPQLMERARRDLAGDPVEEWDAGDLVRKDMMLHFGAFITESSGHLSEYLPYYRTNPETLARYCGPEYDGESSFYSRNWPRWRAQADAQRDRMLAGEESVPAKRSWEYASWIVEAREKNVPYTINGNVPNRGGLIANLPHDGIVEVATLVDRAGARPTRYGRLPAHMAAVCASNMAVYDLGAQAAVERSKEAAILAVTLDPLTAAVCSPGEIRAMVLELFDAEADSLPGYR